jgi:hypothetical protein
MSLRIGQRKFFDDTYRTRDTTTVTNKEQADCENAVEQLFRDFLHQQSSFGLK